MLDEIKKLDLQLKKAKSKKDCAIIHNKIHEIQENCSHEFEIDGKYKVCIHCDFMDVYIKRKRRVKKNTDTELF